MCLGLRSGTVNIADKMQEIDQALGAFSAEMKDQGVWDDVTVIVMSEFGRTLEPNGQGTDHGWGGNYFVLGGGVRGGEMLGRYPDQLLEFESDANVGRGRMIPTTPWEGTAPYFGPKPTVLTALSWPCMATWPRRVPSSPVHAYTRPMRC